VEELVVKEEEEAAPEGKKRGFDHNAAPGQLSARLAGASKEVRFSHLPNPARSRQQLSAGAATGAGPVTEGIYSARNHRPPPTFFQPRNTNNSERS